MYRHVFTFRYGRAITALCDPQSVYRKLGGICNLLEYLCCGSIGADSDSFWEVFDGPSCRTLASMDYFRLIDDEEYIPRGRITREMVGEAISSGVSLDTGGIFGIEVAVCRCKPVKSSSCSSVETFPERASRSILPRLALIGSAYFVQSHRG